MTPTDKLKVIAKVYALRADGSKRRGDGSTKPKLSKEQSSTVTQTHANAQVRSQNIHHPSSLYLTAVSAHGMVMMVADVVGVVAVRVKPRNDFVVVEAGDALVAENEVGYRQPPWM